MALKVGGFAALIAYTLTIFGANWAIQRFGVIPVGFGLLAPAGVYFVGLAFPLRDYIQRGKGIVKSTDDSVWESLREYIPALMKQPFFWIAVIAASFGIWQWAHGR